ncbi:hypothetical protein ACFL6I_18090 [candidate division KSB1 bacterium]
MDVSIFKLDDDNLWYKINAKFKKGGGAYKLICRKDGDPIPVPRLLDIDNEGILYIGKADEYLLRIIDLKKAILPGYKSDNHICGRRYNKNPKISKRFPIDSLYVEFYPSEKPDDKETELIQIYFNNFGEVPPLNAQNK